MKIDNKPIPNMLAVAMAVIPRPEGKNLSLLIRSTPVGFTDKLEEELPTPQAPYVTTCKNGKKVTERDLNDPEFKKALEQNTLRKNTLIIHHGLQANKKLTFDSKQGEGSLGDFADSLREEFQRDGLTQGDLVMLLDQIDRLSNDTMEQVKEARGRFLSQIRGGAKESPGVSQENMASLSNS